MTFKQDQLPTGQAGLTSNLHSEEDRYRQSRST